MHGKFKTIKFHSEVMKTPGNSEKGIRVKQRNMPVILKLNYYFEFCLVLYCSMALMGSHYLCDV